MKRKADDDPAFDNVKLIKIEKDDTADRPQDVKKKISVPTRTGQACDRCRIRKMRCDDQQDGCAPCMQIHSECKTTDRITGKATVRGYVQNLERQLEDLQNRNRELEGRLVALGEEVKPHTDYGDPPTAYLVQWHERQGLGNRQEWEGSSQNPNAPHEAGNVFNGTTGHRSSSNAAEEPSPRLPDFRSGLAGNNYQGVSMGNSLLSSIRGTSMNVLGMEIDLTDYLSTDVDEPDSSLAGTQPVYNKSCRAFVQTAFGMSPRIRQVELPPKSEGMNYAHVYFRAVNPYLPVVHKPSFMAILTRSYNDSAFEPAVADTVMIHTMFAIMYSQYAVRAPMNAQHKAELNRSSNFHYHHALGFFAQLVNSHTLADVQALTMLCIHVRNFPKPGACWMISSIVLNLAIELGLHRSAKRWAPSTERSVLEIEIRKRVFWSILVIHVITAGSLGRPMALRSDDWDVEMPEAVDDELLSEMGIDSSKPGKCNFLVGLQAFNVMPIQMDLYNNIYAVRRSPETYVDSVLRLERRIRDWQKQWPPELKHESATDNELGRVHAQYLAIYPLHIRLLLRHPSLSLATSPEFNGENLTICMEVSRKMLHHVKQLQRYKSLDGTWQNGSLYVLAVATTLFGHWERRDQISATDLIALKEDMDSWSSIIGDMSIMLGSGRRLQDAVRVPIDMTMGLLTQYLTSKAASLATAASSQNLPPSQNLLSAPTPNSDGYDPPSGYGTYATPPETSGSHNRASTSYLPPGPAMPPPPPPPRPGAAYPDPQFAYPTPYTSNTTTYVPPSYTAADALPATAAAATAYLSEYPTQSSQHNPHYPPSSNTANYNTYHSPGSPTSWRNWAGNMATNLEPRAEYMHSASALMQLGGRSEDPVAPDLPAGGLDASTGQMWPYMIFDGGTAVPQ